MIKKLSVILLSIIMLFAGCESKSASVELVPVEKAEQIKPVIPYKERKFIYTNGITFISKETNKTDEKGIKVTYNYPFISGLKNKDVQDKLNKEFLELQNEELTKLEVKLSSAIASGKLKIEQKNANSFIIYNYNNVIFIDCYANIHAKQANGVYYPCSSSVYIGYDLNTGDRISLEDIFKPGYDYKTKVNNYLCQYLIQNNYDDYEFERMTKPFQGIRENQSFSFRIEGLQIIFDEKNDEFINYGYDNLVLVPIKYIADDIYIFDKYFDKNQNIYEKKKLDKKLLPNEIDYFIDERTHEENDKYYTSISKGKFVNVPNKDIEKKLNDLVKKKIDLESFKKKAVETYESNRPASYSYHVPLFLNAGGYLSMGVIESIFLGGVYESNIKAFNYDFNADKEMDLNDIFESTFDIEAALTKYVKKMKYPVTDEVLNKAIKEAVKANKFYFQEYGANIYLPIEASSLTNEQKWVYIPFNEIDSDNIKLFK